MTTIKVILVPFRVLKPEKVFVLELVPLRDENEFEPHPQSKVFVPFGVKTAARC